MNVEDLIIIIVGLIAFVAGWVFGEVRVLQKLSDLQLDVGGELRKVEEELAVPAGGKIIMELKHEIINDTHYFYTADTGEFVIQGKTLNDAATNYVLAYGRHFLGCFTHSETNKEYCFNDETCAEYDSKSV